MIRKYYVYMLTSPSGKVYIGQTYNIAKRFISYENIRITTSQKHISNSILKYGFHNFKKEILFYNLTKEEANKKEIELIKYYKEQNISLNISKGGEYPSCYNSIITYKINNEGVILEKYNSINEAATLNGIEQSAISIANKSKTFYANNNFYIYEHLFNSGEFITKNYLGKNKEKSVIQLSLKGLFVKRFDSLTKAAKAMGVTHESIRVAIINGCSRKCKEHLWVYEEEYNPEKNYKYIKRISKNLKSILAINKETLESKEYPSIISASRELGIEKSVIEYQIKYNSSGNKKTKFKFKIKDE